MIEKNDPDHIVNKCDSEGHTPLYIAAINGNLGAIISLIDNGAEHFIESKVILSHQKIYLVNFFR